MSKSLYRKNLNSVANAFFKGFREKTRLKVSEWADTYRVLSGESSAEPGQWNTDRAEYLRDIMNEMTNPETRTIAVKKAAQVGWTECINNAVGFFIHQEPSPILLVHPTVEMGEAWSKDRFDPMHRDTPVIRELVKDKKKRESDNTILHKMFPGGHLTIVGANAPSGLAQRPIRIVIGDDVDRFPASAGKEGDPIMLAYKRQQTFWNAKTLLGSTPTLKSTSRIHVEYEKSDKREYHVPCPHCGEYQVLSFAKVVWDKLLDDGTMITGKPASDRKVKEHFPQTAMIECEHCHCLYDDIERTDAIKKGKWVATSVFRGIRGYHITGYMSAWLKLSDIVSEFLSAKTPELLQAWTNTVDGEVFEDQGERINADDLPARAETYDKRFLPTAIRAITAGVDVQGNRLEVQFIGWGENEETWCIEYKTIFGDPAQREVWSDLDILLMQKFETEDQRQLTARACCIDTGGHHAAMVYLFCRKRRNRRIFPTKGAYGARPIWPGRTSRTSNNKDEVFIIGVDAAKDTIYGRLRIEQKKGLDNEAVTTPGYIHFPIGEGFDGAYFDQLTSEEVQTRYREGKPYRVWVLQPGRRNEALDTFVLALAALRSLPAGLRNQVEDRLKAPVPVEPDTDEKPVSAPVVAATDTRAKRLLRPPPMLRQRRDPFT
jgi:phage terminase large subunit GpA-like protein